MEGSVRRISSATVILLDWAALAAATCFLGGSTSNASYPFLTPSFGELIFPGEERKVGYVVPVFIDSTRLSFCEIGSFLFSLLTLGPRHSFQIT